MHCGYCDEKYAKCDEEVITELNEMNVVEHILVPFYVLVFFCFISVLVCDNSLDGIYNFLPAKCS